MPPRANDPPRRGPEPRRGASRAVDPADGDAEVSRGFGGIAEARAYTPRGRTVRENGERGRAPRIDRTGDPFRPALQVLDDSHPAQQRRGADEAPKVRDTKVRDTKDRPAKDRAAKDRAAKDRAAQDRVDSARRDDRGGRAQAGRRDPDHGRSVRAARSESARPAAASARAATGSRARSAEAARPSAPRRESGGPSGYRRAPGRPPGPPAAPPTLADSRRRLRIGTVLALALFVAIGIRLVSLQVLDSPAVAASIMEQRISRLAYVDLPAPRGAILDRTGEALAQSVEARFVYADPELVTDATKTAADLSPLLGIAASTLRAKMAKKTRPGGGASRFEYLARGVDVAIADKILALNLPGIGARRDERRDVPGADLGANLVGFTGEGLRGLEGLEARYDDLLRGQDGKRAFMIGNPRVDKGQLAKEIPGGYNRVTPAQPGSSLQLTIDRDLQYEVERLLGIDMKKVNADRGAAIVIDTHTGDVLAQASYPPWNAAKPFEVDAEDRVDVASSVLYDPGSTHKAFIFGAALQEGIITPSSTLAVGPAVRRGGFLFKDTHPHPKNTLVTMPGLLAYSSNVGTILLADKLNPQRVFEYQQKFGLGAATGAGVPGEVDGRLLAPKDWSGSASGSVPLGMSVSATLLQMVAGYNTIANNGTYVQPHVVAATIGADGTRVPAPAPVTREVLSPQNAAALRTMMEAVVTVPGATGNLAKVDGYRVAGKTGTAAKLINGRYTSQEIGSFIGMAPAENPRYVIGVLADTPGGSGGAVAGPAFSKMMSFTLSHYRVPPSGTKPPSFTILP